eukprot:609243-Amphidinium_carterae.1
MQAVEAENAQLRANGLGALAQLIQVLQNRHSSAFHPWSIRKVSGSQPSSQAKKKSRECGA